MTTKSSVLNSNANELLTLVKKHVHEIVRYKLIPCQMTDETSPVLLPMAEHCSSTLHLNAQHMQCCGRLSW